MIDPLARWKEFGEKPDYAGLLSFGGMPYTEDPSELAGADVAIVGAPMDELVSDRPGARLGPRAIRGASCPHGPNLEHKIDGLAALSVIDFGDAPVVPADPEASHRAIEGTVKMVVDADAVPIVLGGDHSITEPSVRACATSNPGLGLIHFDTHTDTGATVFGAELSHGTVMYRLVEGEVIDPSRYVQIGLRGYWPGDEAFEWQRERGIISHFMLDVRSRGIEKVVEETLGTVGDGPVYLTVDVDVLDPAFVPGTGTPEPGGMSSAQLLWACREIARGANVVGMDVVEVLPSQIGTADATALVADRLVREGINGLAMRRG
jgi:agmatinase